MSRHLYTLCCAAALALAQSPTFANTATASATIANLQFTLTDLRPQDGVSASLSELDEPLSDFFFSSANAQISSPGLEMAHDGRISTSWLGQVQASTALGASNAQASVSGATELTGPYTITATGELVDVPSGERFNELHFNRYVLSARAGSPSGTRALFLSPHTQLTLTASVDLALSTPGLDRTTSMSIASADSSYEIALSFSRSSDVQPLDLGSSDTLTLYSSDAPKRDVLHRDITRTLTNDTDQIALVYLQARTAILMTLPHSLAAPVPEASSGLLWLVGLGGLAFAARRRA